MAIITRLSLDGYAARKAGSFAGRAAVEQPQAAPTSAKPRRRKRIATLGAIQVIGTQPFKIIPADSLIKPIRPQPLSILFIGNISEQYEIGTPTVTESIRLRVAGFTKADMEYISRITVDMADSEEEIMILAMMQ